ncbi:MAG: cAMP receptor protein [Pelotomaculum sp. PtaU1.Bin035]|nr:MAG: cAMP receptor protein [Pelotomaculum sp. PtaU1.Bin035]
MSTDSIIKVLNKISFFKGLDLSTLNYVARYGNLLRADKNTVIFLQGEPGNCMYIIVKGKIKIYRTGKDGKEQTLSELTSSDILGEMSLLDGLERSASAVAIEETILFSLSRNDFQIFLQNNFQVALNIAD